MYDARHPESSDLGRARTLGLASLVPIKVPPAVLGQVGESFAGALSALHRALSALVPVAPAGQPALDAALVELARLERFGVQIQELARVLGGDAPLGRERIDLAEAAREALADWAREALRHGTTLSGPTEPLELEVNAAALSQLLDLGLEYALLIGSSIEVSAGVQGMPPLPMLTLSVQRMAAPQAATVDSAFDELHWLLFVQLARAIGLVPQRVDVGDKVTLMLGFSGVDGTEKDFAPSPVLLPHTESVVGRHVLLLEPQDIARVRAHRLLREAGLRVDAVTTTEAAHDALRDGPPDAVVTGIPVGDARCATLLDEIRIAQPRLRVIELVDDDDAFAFSAPGVDSPARVGRRDLDRTLLPALSQELDAAWPKRRT